MCKPLCFARVGGCLRGVKSVEMLKVLKVATFCKNMHFLQKVVSFRYFSKIMLFSRKVQKDTKKTIGIMYVFRPGREKYEIS